GWRRAGPRPRLVYQSRLAGTGKLDGEGLLDFVCREVVGLPGGRAALQTLPPGYRRERPCTVALDNYGVHHSKPVKAALPALEAIGVAFYYLPAYSPELNRIEPEWHALKYDRLQDRSFTTGSALKAAVDAALDAPAAELRAPARHLGGAAEGEPWGGAPAPPDLSGSRAQSSSSRSPRRRAITTRSGATAAGVRPSRRASRPARRPMAARSPTTSAPAVTRIVAGLRPFPSARTSAASSSAASTAPRAASP